MCMCIYVCMYMYIYIIEAILMNTHNIPFNEGNLPQIILNLKLYKLFSKGLKNEF